MIDLADILLIILIVIFVALSAFFSGSEIAFASANKMRMKKEAEKGKKTAKLALYISENYTKSIAAILAGNNLVNIACASAATVLMTKHFNNAETITTIGLTIIILIFGEIFPKIIASELADKIVYVIAWPLKIVMTMLSPIVYVVSALVNKLSPIWTPKETQPQVTQEELVNLIDAIEEEGVFTEKESELIKSAVEFTETTAKDILTPRVDMFAYDIDDDIKTLLKDKDTMSFSRVPVYKDRIDNIIGILSSKKLVKEMLVNPNVKVEDLLSPPMFVHMTRTVSSILKEFRRTRSHMAVVIDEFGGVMGIITLEDVIEEIVGEIYDESDEVETEFEETEDGIFTVDGGLNIYDLFNLIEYEPKDFESEYTTVGGWATEMLDKFPEVGDTFTHGRITLTVTEAQAMRVETVKVELAPDPEDEDSEKEDNE
jgi:CBS domain containing-hemolysin-like protein